jgi:hypothetical protein
VPIDDILILRINTITDEDNEELLPMIISMIFENTIFGQIVLKGYLISKIISNGIVSNFSDNNKILLLKESDTSYFLITSGDSKLKITQYLKQN